MPANKEALIRYRVIDACLRNRHRSFPNMDDLIRALEDTLGKPFSVSTVQKDIKSMKEDEGLGYHAPIAFHRARKGYYYTDEQYSLSGIPLSSEDLAALDFATNLLEQFRDIPIFRQYGDAVDKILDTVQIGKALEGYQEERFVEFESAEGDVGSRWLEPLVQAIRNRQVLLLSYQRFSSEALKVHRIHPQLLKQHKHRWYLIAKLDDGFVITFGLDRIRKLEATEDRATLDFDRAAYFRHAIGITTDATDGPEKVVLEFNEFHANYVRSQPLHSSQVILSESPLRIQLDVFVTHELITLILGYGPGVKVIEPEHIKTKIKSTLQASLEHYP